MIKTFENKALEAFWAKGETRRLPVRQHDRVRLILNLLDAAQHPSAMDLPGMHWHYMVQHRYWSVRVTGNWRITYRWNDGAADVNIQDYH